MNTPETVTPAVDSTATVATIPPTAPGPTPVRIRHEQSQELANAITEAGRLINAAQQIPEAADALAAMGYGSAEFAVGLALVEETQARFQGRQMAMAQSAQWRAQRDAAFSLAWEDYISFRVVVKGNYRGSARTSLGGANRLSQDSEKFLSSVRSVYAAALQEPHRSVLGQYGLSEGRFALIQEHLNQFEKQSTGFKQADHDAENATLARDEAAAKMIKWVRIFEQQARIAFRRRPDLAARLGW